MWLCCWGCVGSHCRNFVFFAPLRSITLTITEVIYFTEYKTKQIIFFLNCKSLKLLLAFIYTWTLKCKHGQKGLFECKSSYLYTVITWIVDQQARNRVKVHVNYGCVVVKQALCNPGQAWYLISPKYIRHMNYQRTHQTLKILKPNNIGYLSRPDQTRPE